MSYTHTGANSKIPELIEHTTQIRTQSLKDCITGPLSSRLEQKVDEIGRWHGFFEYTILPYIKELEQKAAERDRLLRALCESTDWIDESFKADEKPEALAQWQALIKQVQGI